MQVMKSLQRYPVVKSYLVSNAKMDKIYLYDMMVSIMI